MVISPSLIASCRGMNKIGKRAAQLNGGHIFNLNGLDSRSLSEE